LQDKREPVSAVEKPVLVRQLELKCSLKARSHRLLFAKPKSTRSVRQGTREAQDFARKPCITHQTEPLEGRKIVEADLGMRSIGDRD
jgi:hypothetical protein